MSRIVLTRDPTAAVAAMAQRTIDMQGREIADLEKLVASGPPAPASAALYRPAAMEMHRAMMTASGADISETWLRKMLVHHRGAVAMSDIALGNGATGVVKAQIEKTRASQQREIAEVEALLRGVETTAMPAPPTTSVAPMTPRAAPPEPPAPAQRPPAMPAPATPKPAAPAPNPHAGHDMNKM